MEVKVRTIDLDAGGKNIVILNKNDAEELGVYPLDRVMLEYKGKATTAIVNTSEKFVKKGEILVYNEVKQELNLRGYAKVNVKRREKLSSKEFIRQKIEGLQLRKNELESIVNDVVEKKLNDLELAAFITSLYIHGISIEEAAYLSEVIANGGEQLKWDKEYVMDKHSLGGVPGDKTTLLVVPIVASANLTIPKTSSRAITSPAGTADRAECIMPVNLSVKEIKKVVEKTNACIAWGGALNMAPADDLFIRIEYPLDLDPLFMPSIMAKKKAAGSTHLVLDLPTGSGTKIENLENAKKIAENFLDLGQKLRIKVQCAITFGEEPIGNCIGPALEAREALMALKTGKPKDLVEKACSLAGILFSMVGKGDKKTAYKILHSGKAEKKFREIIAEQGGDEKIHFEDIKVGEKTKDFCAECSGVILSIKNHEIAKTAKIAGAPKDKEAGILLYKKIGEFVEKGEPLFRIYAKKDEKLREAAEFATKTNPFVIVSKNKDMVMEILSKRENSYRKVFTIER
ncbi:MAG: AMP phosphorylase [Candidatus Altiarchaeota archaeon]